MPSSSPRCAQFPRAQDKVHFYIKLKELRDQMKGVAPGGDVQETRYSFDLQLAKGKAPPTFHTFRFETLRRQRCLCLQKMPRGWPSKRSSTTPSTRAAAACRLLLRGAGEERLQEDAGMLMETSFLHLPDGGRLPGSFHSCWIVSMRRILLEILSVVWWLM